MTTTTEPTVEEPSYLAALAVTQIKPHPANPRRAAKADPEMVASIRDRGLVQPLIVAPAANGKDYNLLAGHRRLDGLKQAKRKTAPAIVRHDITTDAAQIEFAIVENVHRQDLTAMEEAEAFDQLRDMKYTQAEIAQKTGRTVSAVRDRLKLIKLSSQSRDALHQGQLTIGDAFDLLEFADDPKVEAALSKKAGQPGFRQHVEEARRKKAREHEIAAARTKHETDGIPEVKWPTGVTDTWGLKASSGVILLRDSVESDPKKHKDCLAFLVGKQSYHNATYLVCTNPRGHKKTLSAAEKRQRAADEKAKQAHAERLEQEDVARTLRDAAVYELVGEGIQFTPRLRDLLRALLPATVLNLYGSQRAAYCTAMAIDGTWSDYKWERKGDAIATFVQHARALAEASDATLAKALAAILLGSVEGEITGLSSMHPGDEATPLVTASYFELLAGIGHDFTEIDTALRGKALERLQAAAAAATPSPEDAVPDPDDPAFEPHTFQAANDEYACTVCDQPKDAAVHTAPAEATS